MKNSTKLKAGLLLTSLACAAGAELKAMDELEEMMRSESDCASCACAEECPAPETYAAAKNDAAAAETPEEESDGKPDIEIEIVDGDEETDEDDDEPETAGLED